MYIGKDKLFLILTQPNSDSAKYPWRSELCGKCGQSRDAHGELDFPECSEHGIVALLRRMSTADREALTDEQIDEMRAPHPESCPQCSARAQAVKDAGCNHFQAGHNDWPIRAIVRRVSLHQCGHFMMGTARAKGHSITLSGAYGSDGLPRLVLDEVYELGLELPAELREMWNKGGGWNGAGSEAPAMRRWAIDHLAELRYYRYSRQCRRN